MRLTTTNCKKSWGCAVATKTIPTLLLQKAVETKKPTKPEAQRIIMELADRHVDIIPGLAALYAYFMPTPSKKPKTEFDWVALAVSPVDVRDYLRYVHVTAELIEASDGHRVHRVPNTEGLEPGYYLPNRSRVFPSDWRRWPDTEALIPTKNAELLQRSDIKILYQSAKLNTYQFGDRHYDAQLIDQALQDAPSFYAAATADKLKLIYPDRERLALVMPIVLPKGKNDETN